MSFDDDSVQLCNTSSTKHRAGATAAIKQRHHIKAPLPKNCYCWDSSTCKHFNTKMRDHTFQNCKPPKLYSWSVRCSRPS